LPKATSDMTLLQQGQNPTETEGRPGESIASSKQLIVSIGVRTGVARWAMAPPNASAGAP